jgi:tRNA (guanine37-N1)-methyltransferase
VIAIWIDIVTIFPEYVAPLELALIGRAQAEGLVKLRVHDLREWTADRHRTVDDTPYGGGAGMVMRPEPWGEAFDSLAIDGATVIIPTPAGRPFTQADARELARHERLVFACGRYEGIDQRVAAHAAERADVREFSIGDYVVNGGEVATLVIVEAVARLIPGVVGNAQSLTTESHEGGLLEAPAYTKPRSWRGHDVPEILLGGDHQRIAAWRRDQSIRRTVAHRPDLMHPSMVSGDEEIRLAEPSDAGELLTLQRACWLPEKRVNPGVEVPAAAETLDDVRAWLPEWTVFVVRRSGRLVGAVRARLDGDTWDIGRLMVAPDLQGRGLGRRLLALAESAASDQATGYALFTGAKSTANQRLYAKAGYRRSGTAPAGAVRMVKPL